jgi:aminoglycoside phosphotransferase
VFVDYVPESSAVARCLDDAHRVVAYAKVHAGDEGERTYRAHRALWRRADGSGLQISRPIAYSEPGRALLVAPVEGIAISQLRGPELLEGLERYGAALATLHSLPLVEMPPLERDLLGRVCRHADNVGVVRPDAGASIDLLVRELGRRWEETHGPDVLVHGDANTNNAILQGTRVAFIDFDRLATGSAASDIGNFLSILTYLRCLGVISSSSEKGRADAFKRGYSLVRPLPDAASVRVRTSAGLVERAIRAVNCLRPNALRRVPLLLAEARALLGV